LGITRFDTAGAFLEHAEAFLTAREVFNCMPLSIAYRVREHPDYAPLPAYFAAVDVGGEVVAAAVQVRPGAYHWRLPTRRPHWVSSRPMQPISIRRWPAYPVRRP
jgi:hypothetical protein